jgi:hypothetical protein
MTAVGPWAVADAAHSSTIADKAMARETGRRGGVVEQDAMT